MVSTSPFPLLWWIGLQPYLSWVAGKCTIYYVIAILVEKRKVQRSCYIPGGWSTD